MQIPAFRAFRAQDPGYCHLAGFDVAADKAFRRLHLRSKQRPRQVRRGDVRDGEGIARPLAAAGTFPPLVAGMIEVGEETGTLPAMLARIADLYDEEVDRAVTSLMSLIEPVMIVLMAVMVGTIVIALFLPIIRIIQLLT